MSEKTLELAVNGLTVAIDRDALANDIGTLELLADIEGGKAFAIVPLMKHIFGDEQYSAIKAALAVDGRTTVTAMTDFLGEVFKEIGDLAKN